MTAVDRAALIEAGALAMHQTYCQSHLYRCDAPSTFDRAQAEAVLNAALPFIANALESDLPTGTDRLSLGISKGKRRSARLVRSLLSTDNEQ